MKFKYAAEPWKLDLEGNGKEIFITGGEEGSGWERFRCSVMDDDCDHDLAVATAKLIHKSPKLLKACQKALRAFETQRDDLDEPCLWQDEIKALKSAMAGLDKQTAKKDKDEE